MRVLALLLFASPGRNGHSKLVNLTKAMSWELNALAATRALKGHLRVVCPRVMLAGWCCFADLHFTTTCKQALAVADHLLHNDGTVSQRRIREGERRERLSGSDFRAV